MRRAQAAGLSLGCVGMYERVLACAFPLSIMATCPAPLVDPSLVATVFAPSDDAFAELLNTLNMTADQLLEDTVRLTLQWGGLLWTDWSSSHSRCCGWLALA